MEMEALDAFTCEWVCDVLLMASGAMQWFATVSRATAAHPRGNPKAQPRGDMYGLKCRSHVMHVLRRLQWHRVVGFGLLWCDLVRRGMLSASPPIAFRIERRRWS